MKAAVCAWVKNEESDIAEWIAFHLAVGFQTCIILDNDSTDRTLHAARLYRHEDRVRINQRASNCQMNAYEDCISKHGRDFEWMAFIDSDEFFVPKENNLEQFLAPYTDAAAIGINWAVYGTSGHVERPSGLITECLLNRSAPEFGPNRHIKSIVRPDQVVKCVSPHVFVMRGSYTDDSGEPLDWENPMGLVRGSPRYSRCQVNHYFLRSRWHWEAKLRRGYQDGVVRRPTIDFEVYDRNEIYDDTAVRFVPETKRLLSKFQREQAMSRGKLAAFLRSFS